VGCYFVVRIDDMELIRGLVLLIKITDGLMKPSVNFTDGFIETV